MIRNDTLLSENQSQKIEISVSCRQLPNFDIVSVTDSFLVIKLAQFNQSPKKILQTQIYWNDLNPNYAQSVTVNYTFEVRQNLIFQVYHQASPPQLVGSFETTIGQIFSSPSKVFKGQLIGKNNKPAGKIIVRYQKTINNNSKQIQFDLGVADLPDYSCCFIYKNKPFLRVYQIRNDEDVLIYESKPQNGMNAQFSKFTLSQCRLTKNYTNQFFRIDFLNYSDCGNHDYSGHVNIPLNEIQKAKNYIIKDKQGLERGVLHLKRTKKIIKYQFTDYIQAGLQLALVTCIDFTASNGHPTSPQSLHFITPHKLSQYAQALSQVTKILMDYDYDKLVPVYGFGAKVRMPKFNSGNSAHHCFPINGNQQNPNIFQYQGILNQYAKCLQFLQFSGPTRFSGLLTQSMKECVRFKKQNNQYMILFILTDGQIHDMSETIDLLIQCCNLPLSIIIVGVGNGDFTNMHILDDDDCQLKNSHGVKTTRDLVQFVQFRKFKNNPLELARQVLEQLPRQVVQYYKLMNMTPANIKRNHKTDIDWQIQSSHKQNYRRN